MKIRVKLIFGMGITYGLVLLFLKIMLRLSQKELWIYYIISAVLLFDALLFKQFMVIAQLKKKSAEILPLMQVEKDPIRYIKEMEKLLRVTKNQNNRALLTMNIACGYAENGDYNTAYEIFESIDPNIMLGMNQAIYYLDSANFCFNLGEEELAVAIMKENEELFRQYEKHPIVGCCIAINKVYQYLAEKDMEKAKEVLIKAENLCNMPYLEDEIQYLKALILVEEDCFDDAKIIIAQMKETKLMPSIEGKVRKLIDSL